VLKLYHGPWREMAEREAAIGRMAYAAGVPTPRVDEIVEIEGRVGIIFERVNGPTLLHAMFTHPWETPRLARAFAELHLAVHRARVPELPSAKAALEWAMRNAEGLTDAQREALLQRLAQLDESDVLCHGDFHPDQVLATPQGLRVIDWPNSARGDPALDVARTVLMLLYGAPPPGMQVSVVVRTFTTLLRQVFTRGYLRRYLRGATMRRADIDAWMPVIAAHRLTEAIPGERDTLLRLIDAGLQ
jgi:aminoglycoside phosphotransferase (APT) family kinase protein